MKYSRPLFFLFFSLITLHLFAQFGPGRGGGGGFGAGQRPPGGRQEQTAKPNRPFVPEDDGTENARNAGPKIGSVAGNVTDAQGIPIEYATIAVLDDATGKVVTGGITNVKGNFTVKQLPAGRYRVKITFIGFSDYNSPAFDLSASQRTYDVGKVALTENANMLDDVVVVADVTTIENRIDKQVVNVGKDLMTAGASARDVFENLPMVEVDFDGNVSMRGSENIRVLLDNRPTNMSVQDLIESLPADAIDKIELITNPSAKQDPDGMGGIINIITKKGLLYGLNFSTRVGVDTKNKWNGGVNLGYYYGKVMVYANYSFRYNSSTGDNETYRGNYNTSSLYPDPYLNYQRSLSDNSRVSHNLRAGIDYLPNKKTALSYSIGYNRSTNEQESQSYSYFLPLDGIAMDDLTKEKAQDIVQRYQDDLDSYFNRYRHSLGDNRSNTLRNSLTLRRDYSNYENLVVDLSYETDVRKDHSSIENRLGAASADENTRDHSLNDTDNKELTFSVDYTKEVRGRSKLEFGGRADLIWRNTPYFYYMDFVDRPEIGTQPDMDRSNHFKYDQQLYSLYATYSRSFGNFSFQGGLRAEETLYKTQGLGLENENGNIVYVKDRDVVIDRDYFSLYPSLSLMYKFGNNNDVSAKYSRRVSRPNSRNLNPTPTFTDPLYVTIGNPYLDPSFTDAVELKYSRQLNNGFFNLASFFRNSTDMMQRVTQRENPVDPDKTEPGTLYTTTINIGSQYTLGLNLYASYRFFKWWNSALMLDYYYQHKDIPERDDYVRASNDFSARLRNSFNLSKAGTRIQFNLRYRAPSATLQGTSSAMFTADAGISQDFLKKRLSASINVQDLFNSMSFRGNTYGQDFVLFNNNTMDTRIVRFSLAYKFAEMKFKDKRLKGAKDGERPDSDAENPFEN